MHGTYIGEGKMLIRPVWGSHLIVPAGDLSITPYLITSGVFEAPLTNFFLRRVKPGDVVFDIGANSGYYTTMLGRLVGPQGKVVAYEPDPKMLRFLADNVGTNYLHKQVEIRNRAVYSKETELTLHVSEKFAGHSSIYKRDSSELRDFDTRFDPVVQEVSVQADTLDGLIGDYPKVDYIKMDIEGGEYEAFLGMKEMLTKGIAGTVIFEWARQALNENTDAFVALLGELSQQSGMVFYYLDAEGNPIPTTLADFSRADFIHSVLLSRPL